MIVLPTLSTVIARVKADIRNGKNVGLPSGMELERLVPTGIPLGKITVLFGESGNYKSTVKNALIENIAKSGHNVLDVSLEDSDELGAERTISRLTGSPYGRLDKSAVDSVKPPAWADNVYMAGEVSPNIDAIIDVARQYKHDHDIKAVFIDYIQLLEGVSRGDERTAISNAMRKAQLAAKYDELAYVFVSQVNRSLSSRETDHRPRLSDLFGSSTIEQHCKLAIGIYRPFKRDYEPRNSGSPLDRMYFEHFNNSPAFRTMYPRLLELSVQKNLVGENGIVHIEVDPPTGKIVPSKFREMM